MRAAGNAQLVEDDRAVQARRFQTAESVRPGAIVASVVAWSRAADGATVASLRVGDGTRTLWLDVLVPAGAPLPPGREVELAVEGLARTLPPEGPLDDLAARAPLTWHDGAVG